MGADSRLSRRPEGSDVPPRAKFGDEIARWLLGLRGHGIEREIGGVQYRLNCRHSGEGVKIDFFVQGKDSRSLGMEKNGAVVGGGRGMTADVGAFMEEVVAFYEVLKREGVVNVDEGRKRARGGLGAVLRGLWGGGKS